MASFEFLIGDFAGPLDVSTFLFFGLVGGNPVSNMFPPRLLYGLIGRGFLDVPDVDVKIPPYGSVIHNCNFLCYVWHFPTP